MIESDRGDHDERRRVGVECAQCGEEGHERVECPAFIASLFCFICGETGHKRVDCAKKIPDDDLKDGACFVCGEDGHAAHKCEKRHVDPKEEERRLAKEAARVLLGE